MKNKTIGNAINLIFPYYRTYIKNKKTESNRDKSPLSFLEDDDSVDNYSLEYLRQQYTDTLGIKDKLEDKAKACMFSLTIGISLILNAPDLLEKAQNQFGNGTIMIVFTVLFSIAFVYMLLVGVYAYRMLTNKNKIANPRYDALKADSSLVMNDLAECIQYNRLSNIIRSNDLCTSFDSLRNALVSISLAFIMLIIPFEANINGIQQNTPQSYQHKKIEIVYSKSSVDSILIFDNRQSIGVTLEQYLSKNQYKAGDTDAIGFTANKDNYFLKFKIIDSTTICILQIDKYKNP